MGLKQWHIWKITAALEHFANVYGTVGMFRPSNYTFLYNSTGYIQSCVHLPYLFIVGILILTYRPRLSIVLHVHCIPALITPFHITMLALR